ncbi:hypothetical protein [Peristeroidobacter agariperforans]|uniref:hypothetical protein n=1 Tax=Peristeroidobacter agariperforans TaxID=268404 RepID=UPI00101C54C9|nr:hypothetical protein [Peristeroidobacter agariperforans]
MENKTIRDALRGFVTNAEGMHDYQCEIGSIIINGGAIELLIDVMIQELMPEGERPPIEELRDGMFARRRSKLVQLVGKSALSSGLKSELTTALEKAEAIMRVRNIIAHGPMVVVYEGEPEAGKPKGLAFLMLKDSKNMMTPYADIEGLRRTTANVYDVARELEALLSKMTEEMAAKP